MRPNQTLYIALLSFFSIFLVTGEAYAQSLDVDLVSNTHNGGYHISCFGATDGNITSVVTGGTAPYSYQWSSGQTTADLTNIGHGNYSLTVTDSLGAAFTASITLTQPNKLEVTLDPVELAGGTHISANGASDGMITTTASGGTPPYTYLWNDDPTAPIRKYIPAGTYSLTLSDANSCSASGSVTLVEPDPLTVTLDAPMNGGSWNISCFSGADGSIDATVSGGVQPYSFHWSHGAFDEDVNDLEDGEDTVQVTDANGVMVSSSVSLTQPTDMDVTVTLTDYPNGHHVSCHDCFNGNATVTTQGGAGAFTYLWADNSTSATRNDLGLPAYGITVTDANGCTKEKNISLSIPTCDDWTMNGNEIQPQQFIGSTNEEDVVFKVFNQPQLRLGADGITRLLGGVEMGGIGNASTDDELLFIGPNGTLGSGGSFQLHWNDQLLEGCNRITTSGTVVPSWTSGPNKLFVECDLVNVGIGTDEPAYKLDVIGTVRGEDLRLEELSSVTTIGSNGLWKNNDFTTDGDEASLFLGDTYNYVKSIHGNGLALGTYNGQDALRILQGGYVAIGPESGCQPSYELEVNGVIRSKEVIVEVNWCDYVFEDDYELRSLEEVEAFIEQNGHLPDVPSEAVISENGAPLGESTTTLLRKVEELTLYMIDLKKENDKLKEAIVELQSAKQ